MLPILSHFWLQAQDCLPTRGKSQPPAVGGWAPTAWVAQTACVLLGLASMTAQAQPPGGFGGFPGGPPGGGPGGGPPVFMGGGPWGGDRGGDRGRDRGRGEDRGGDRGERRGGWGGPGGPGGPGGGMGGGFDPSQFISRMDTNGNGSIDPEEAQGPARFMLDRLARSNPKIDITKPIPISVLTESFQQMRSGGSPWGGPGGGDDSDTVNIETNTLVPGFGMPKELVPVPGFGAAAERFSIRVEERDLRDADERLRRYDRNNDGALDENELREARWNDSPTQWDRNRDGKLSRQELAARYALRREQRSGQETGDRAAEAARNRTPTPESQESEAPVRPFEKIASYRIGSAEGPSRPAGLPEWFARDDADGDNQVSMREFARSWDASTLEDFLKFDANEDGFITTRECLAGVKKGYLKGSTGGSSASDSGSSSASPATTASKPNGAGGNPDAEMRDWCQRKISRLDKDKNGFLTPEEFSDSSVKFGDVDKDGNGQINLDEYVAHRSARK